MNLYCVDAVGERGERREGPAWAWAVGSTAWALVIDGISTCILYEYW